MSKVKVKLNMKGINEVMKSPEIAQAVQEAGERVAELAGEGHEVHVYNNLKYTTVGFVDAVTPEAVKANFEDNTLLKAVHAAGLSLTKGQS